MRSRYTAFTRGDDAYLSATWHASTRPAEVRAGDGTKWLGLDVREHKLLDPDHAEVEFVARWRVNGKGGRLHERSRFVREGGHWFYVDGDVR
jgi:SEC-C motif-containing protein